MRLDLTKILNNVPRDKFGTPRYETVEQLRAHLTEDEVLELVNRSVYNLDYQKTAHRKYHNTKAELERPIRELFKELFPKQSFAKATREQLRTTMLTYKERQQ
jgi:hypothetical protein